MSRTWWVRRLFDRRSTAASVVSRPAARPQVFGLEDRVVPANSILIQAGGLTAIPAGASSYADTTDYTLDPSALTAAAGPITLRANATITFDASVAITAAGVTLDAQAKQDVAVNAGKTLDAGANALTLTAARSVGVAGTVQTTSGTLTLSANQQATPTAGNFTGVFVNGGIVTTAAGGIQISGRGGDTGSSNAGLFVLNGGVVSSTGTGAGAGTIDVTGTSQGGTDRGHGVRVTGAGSAITSADGAVQVTGAGGPVAGQESVGVLLEAGGRVISTGTAPVAVTGTAVAANLASIGVLVIGRDAGGTDAGVESVSGAVTVTGTAGTAPSGASGVYIGQAGGRITSTGTAPVTVTADSIAIQSAGGIAGGTATVTLQPRTAGTTIDLGGADVATGSPLALGLTAAELNAVTAGRLVVGSPAAGALTVSAAVAPTGTTQLELVTGGGIGGAGKVTLARLGLTAGGAVGLTTAVGTLAVQAGGDVTVANTGALTVGTVNGLVGVTGTGVTISAASPLTVAADVVGAGTVTPTAGDSAGTGDDLTVNAGVTVRSTAGDVALNAGDNLLVDPTSTVRSDAGTVFLRVDFGNADAGVGGTLSVPAVFAKVAVQVAGDADPDSFALSGTAAGVTTTLTAGAGADTVSVTKTAGPLVVNAGAGLDVVNVGNGGTVGSPGLLSPVAGKVTVDGGTEGAALTVDGSGAGINADYTVTDTTVTRTAPAGFGGVTYGNLTSLLLTVGGGANVVAVTNTAAGVTTTVNTNDGADTVNVTKTNATGPLFVDTGLGADAVNVGNSGTVGGPGLLSPVAGAVTVDGGSDGAALTVDGSGAGINADYALTGTTVTRTAPAGFGGVTYGNLTSLLLSVGSGANVVTVAGTSVPTTVNTNGGADTVAVTGPGVLAALAVNTGTEDDAVVLTGAPAAAVTVDGGAGADALTVNGSAAADTFVVAPNGTRVSVQQTGPAPFTLDVGTVETVAVNSLAGADSLTARNLAGVADLVTLQLNGGADDDSFFVTPSAAVGVQVDGGSPVAPTRPGDSLTLDAENNPLSQAPGADASSGTLSVPGRQPVLFTSIETLAANNVSATQVTGTAAADTVVLYRDAGNTLVYTVNGGLPLAVFGPQFRFDGLGGKDRLQVDYKGGDPLSGLYDLPSGKDAVAFDGTDKQGDTLLVVGPGATAAAGRTALYVPTAKGAGRVELADLGGLPAGRRVVTFQNLTPVDLTGLALVTISPAGAVDTLTVSEGFDHFSGTKAALLVGGTSDAFAVEELAAWNNGGLVVDAPGAGSTLTVLGAANAHGNTDLTFTSEAVNVRGNVTAAGLVTLTNSGTLTLGGAGKVTVSGGTGVVQNGAGPVTLADDATLTSAAGPVSVKTAVDSAAAGVNTLTATATTGTVTLGGSVGAATRPAGLAVTGKAIVLGGAAYQTKLVQTFTGPTTVTAPAVRFDSTTQGVAFFGTLDSGASPTPASAVTVSTVTGLLFGDKVGSVRPLASLDVVAGPTTVAGAAGGAVTSVGRQLYAGPVVLAADTALTGGEFVFNGTIDGDASPNPNRALTVTVTDPTKAAAFNAPVGRGGPGTTPPFTTQTLQSLTVNGASQFAGANAGVRTVGDQTYNGPVTLVADASFTSVPAGNYATNTGAGNIRFNGTVDAAVAGGAALSIGSAGTARFGGAVGGTKALAAVSAAGGVLDVAGGAVTSTGPQVYASRVRLEADAVFTATNPPPVNAGDVRFLSTLNAVGAVGPRGATVNTPGGGTTLFNNNVGDEFAPQYARLSFLRTDAAGRTLVGSATTATPELLVQTTGDQTFGDPLTTLGKDTRFRTAGGVVRFGGRLGATTPGGQAAVIDGTGSVRFDGAVGDSSPLRTLTVNPGIPATVGGGVVTTFGDQTFFGDVLLAANATFTTTAGGSVQFVGVLPTAPGRLDSAAGGPAFGATVNTPGGGLTVFFGKVGSVNPLAYLKTDAGGSTVVNGPTVTTVGDQLFGDDVRLGSTGTRFDSGPAGPISFFGRLDAVAAGVQGVVVSTAADTTFNSPVGGLARLASLVADGGGTTFVDGGLVATTGPQRYGDDTASPAVPEAVRVGTAGADGTFSASNPPPVPPATQPPAGNITFVGPLDSLHAIRVNTPARTTFGGPVGATAPPRLLATDAGGDTVVSGGLVQTQGEADDRLTTDRLTGDQRYRDRVLVAGIARFVTLGAAGGRAVTFNSSLESSPAGTADVTVTPAAGGSVTFVGSVFQLNTLTVDGGTAFVRTDTVNTVNGQTYSVPVRLGGADLDGVFGGADVVFTSTAGGAVTFASTLDAFAPAGVRGATVVSTGPKTFGGPVGGAEPLAFLVTTFVGPTFVNGGLVRTVGRQSFNNDVVLGTPAPGGGPVDTLFQTGPTGFVVFNGRLDALARGVQGATVRTAGDTTFGKSVGGLIALAYLATDGGGTTFVAGTSFADAGLVSTVGGQFFFDPVSVTGNATFQTVDKTTGAVPGVGPISFLDTGANSLRATGVVTICTAGAVTFEGTVTVASLSIECGGSIDLNGGSVSTPGGVQRYTGDVTLTADTVLTANAVTFDRRVDSDGVNRSLDVVGAVTFGGEVGGALRAGLGGRSPLRRLAVTGPAFVNGRLVLTADGGDPAQVYGGPVRVGADALFETAGSGLGAVTFASTLDEAAGAGQFGVTVRTGGPTTFAGAVGGAAPLGELTTDAGGVTRVLGPLVRTTSAGGRSGGQRFLDRVSAGSTLFQADGAGTVTFNAALDAEPATPADVRVATGGSVSFVGPVSVGSLAVDGGPAFVRTAAVTTARAQTYTAAVVLGGAGVGLPFGGADVAFTSTGGGTIRFNALDALPFAGPFGATVNTAGDTVLDGPVGGSVPLGFLATDAPGRTLVRGPVVRTAGGQVYNDPVGLVADVAFTGTTVRFADTLDGPAGATVNAATTFSKAVGAATPPASLTVNGSAGVDGGLVRTAGAQTFNGPVAVSAGTDFAGGDVRFNGTLTGNVPVAVNSPGETAFNGAVAVGSLTTDAPGRVSVGAANVSATGAVLFNDPVTTFAPGVTFSGSSVRFATKLGNDGKDVTVASGGATVFDGEVKVGSLRTDAPGTTAVNGGLVETVRQQVYGDPVAVGKATTFRSTGGGSVSFEQALTGPFAVGVETADNTIFLGAVDVDSLRTDATGFTRVNGGLVRTANEQRFDDIVTVDARDALFQSTGNQAITFGRSLDGITGRAKGVTLTTAGDTRLGGPVGVNAVLASLTANGGGRTLVAGPQVVTSGDQDYSDGVAVDGSNQFNSQGGRVTFRGPVTTPLTVDERGTPFGVQVVAPSFDLAGGSVAAGFFGFTGTTAALNGGVAVDALFVLAGGDVTQQGRDILARKSAYFAVDGKLTLQAGSLKTAELVVRTGGGVAQPGGTVAAGRLDVESGGQAVEVRLDQPGNDFSTLRARLSGGSSLFLSDANDLTVTAADPANNVTPFGVAADSGDITVRLRTGGGFTADATSLVNVGPGGQFVVYPGLSGSAKVVFRAPATARQVVLGQPGTRTNGTSDLVAPPTPGQSAVPGYVSPTGLPDEANAPAFGAGNVGADTFTVRPTAGARVFVFGNNPRLPLPVGAAGDSLVPEFLGADGKTALSVTGFGSNGQDGFYDLAGAQRLTFNGIEGLAGLSQAAFVAQTGEPGDATGATSQQYNVRVVRTQNGTPLPGGLQGARLPENPFVVSPALVDPAASTQPPRTAFGDFNGDNIPDLVLANGPGTPPLVTVIDGRALDPTLNPGGQLTDISRLPAEYLLAQFYAYDPGFQGGVNVAVGKLGANGEQTITTGADEGGGPHVRTFALRYVGRLQADGTTNKAFDPTSPTPYVPAQLNASFGNFFAYEAAFTGGVRVAVADVTGDGRDDLVLTPGAGGGPRVRVFAGEEWGNRTDAILGTTRAFADFFTVEESFRGGLYVAAGKYRPGGTRADILVGAASGGAPRVMIFNTDGLTPGTTQTPVVLANFFAFDLTGTGTLNDPLFGRANTFTGVGGVSFGGRASTGGYLDVLVGTARGPQLKVRRFAGGMADPTGALTLAEEFTTSGSTTPLVSVAGATLKPGSLNYGATVGGFVAG